MEIEKKYLFDELPGKESDFPCDHMMQAYISRDPVIRIRSIEKAGGDKAYVLTIKGEGLTMREEHELKMTKEQFDNLLPKTSGKVIDKLRYRIPLGIYAEGEELVAEADCFLGDHQGLRIVEVEFPSEEAMNDFKKPAWFKEDVSGDNRYHNSELSK